MNQNDQKPDDLLNSLEQAVPPADTSAKKRYSPCYGRI